MNIEHSSEIEDDFTRADPTTYSRLDINGIFVYRREDPSSDEVFISLLSKGIINVCEMFEDENEGVYSIPLDLTLVQQELNLQQILADISLIEVISGNMGDRCIVPGYDYRTKSKEFITGNNCRIDSKGTYSVFDIDYISIEDMNEETILKKFYLSLSGLYGLRDSSTSLSYLLDGEMTDKIFGQRIAERVNLFLERYNNDEGKKLFLRQIAHSQKSSRNFSQETRLILKNKEDIWYDHENKMYKDFISILIKIEKIFSQNPEALARFMATNRGLILEMIKLTVGELYSLIKGLIIVIIKR